MLMQWGVLGLAAVTLIINVLIAFGPRYFDLHVLGITSDLDYDFYIDFFGKERLPLSRIALFLVWFWAAFSLFRRFEPLIIRWLGWLLLPFGMNSLYVYTVHAFIIFFVHIWLRPAGVFINFIIAASIIAFIRIMIHYKVLMKIIPR
jgi:hypothetical protein